MYMRKLSYLLTFLSFFLFAGCASATTYYIDHGSGSDANNGTSKTTPWMHAPGMLGCTAICASTTPNQGDSFILKGGVTWPNAVFPDHWVWSGTSGSPIYIGVDKSWYAGAAWVRPIFDAGGVAMSYNSFFQAQSISHVQFDNIHQSFDATEHENAIEAIGGNGIYYIHDNVISGSVYGENMMIGNTGETDYIWNNVIASASGNPIHFPQSTGKSNMNMYAWNNTIVPASGSPCFLWVSGFGGSWNTVDIRNNQCIATSGSIASSGFTVPTLIVGNNAMLTR